MASAKPLRDWLYLWIIGAQLVGMLLLDFVPFYPSALWQPSSSPFHFLVWFGNTYVDATGDPYAKDPAAHPFFEALTYIELVSQFPLAVYLVKKLATKRPTDGATEVAGLAFACLTAMGSAICCFDLWHMGPESFVAGQQMKLLYTEFGPYTIIPGFMAVDMYMRLLGRLRDAEKAKQH